MQRYCFALDLKDNEQLIDEYEEHHRHVWKEVLQSIQNAGVEAMDIYRTRSRLFMIMEVSDTFSFEVKAAADAANKHVQDWENLMWQYQQPLPWAKEEKWVLMSHVFQLPKASI